MNNQAQDFTDALLGKQDAEPAPVTEPHYHCYVCGVEVDEDDCLDGPELAICPRCYGNWMDRCYMLLDEMKKEMSQEAGTCTE